MIINTIKKYRRPSFEQHFKRGYCVNCGRKALDTGYCAVDTTKYIKELGKHLEAKNE